MAKTNLTETTDRRIDALLALLADNTMIVISGAKIAREIGVTRSTVWRWIEKLRALHMNATEESYRARFEKYPAIARVAPGF